MDNKWSELKGLEGKVIKKVKYKMEGDYTSDIEIECECGTILDLYGTCYENVGMTVVEVKREEYSI